MRMLEDRRELHAQAGEIVDVEEAPVVDLVLGHAMKGDAPELRADQAIEFAPVAVESPRPAPPIARARLDRPRCETWRVRVFRAQRRVRPSAGAIAAGRETDPPAGRAPDCRWPRTMG